MKISPIQNFINFKGATININALSDTHGHIELADNACQALMQNDMFEKEQNGKANFIITGGDWCMSGGKKGFMADKNKPLMEFQIEIFNAFINKIKEKYPSTTSIFVPGNHDLDGGIKIFADAMKKINATVLMSNLNFKNSPALQDMIEANKLVSSKIDFVKDDKDPNLEHAVLNLGVSPVNLEYYQSKEKTKGLNLFDNFYTPQKYVKPEQYEKTMQVVRQKIKDFKKQYPTGTVVLTSHTGVNFAANCAKQGDIDLIFDAHEHKDNIEFVNNTPIIALSQNFEKIVNAKITLGDKGERLGISIKDIHPNQEKHPNGEISAQYEEMFKNDSQKMYTIKINPNGNPIKILDTKGVRSQNSNLASFITDSILKEIQKSFPDVQIFALNASSIRGGFEVSNKPTVSPLDISNCLAGIQYEDAEIYTTDVSGEQLAALVADNFLFNQESPEKNPIIQYSGIVINKTDFMKDYANGKPLSELCKYIVLQDSRKKIDPKSTYKIANPEKYFIKASNQGIKNLKNKSEQTGLNVHDLFKQHFENDQKEVYFTPVKKFY